MGDGEKLLTHLNSALKVLLRLDIFPRVPKKKLNFVDQCYLPEREKCLYEFRKLVLCQKNFCRATYGSEVNKTIVEKEQNCYTRQSCLAPTSTGKPTTVHRNVILNDNSIFKPQSDRFA